jgi:hypothetical protein
VRTGRKHCYLGLKQQLLIRSRSQVRALVGEPKRYSLTIHYAPADPAANRVVVVAILAAILPDIPSRKGSRLLSQHSSTKTLGSVGLLVVLESRLVRCKVAVLVVPPAGSNKVRPGDSNTVKGSSNKERERNSPVHRTGNQD